MLFVDNILKNYLNPWNQVVTLTGTTRITVDLKQGAKINYFAP